MTRWRRPTICSWVNRLFFVGCPLSKSHLSRNQWYERIGQVRWRERLRVAISRYCGPRHIAELNAHDKPMHPFGSQDGRSGRYSIHNDPASCQPAQLRVDSLISCSVAEIYFRTTSYHAWLPGIASRRPSSEALTFRSKLRHDEEIELEVKVSLYVLCVDSKHISRYRNNSSIRMVVKRSCISYRMSSA